MTEEERKEIFITKEKIFLHEVIEDVKWNDIKNQISRLYSEQIKNISGYECLLKNLKKAVSIKTDYQIKIDITNGGFDGGESYHHVFGKKIKSFEGSEDFKKTYSLSLSPWTEWLGMTISKSTLETYKYEEIAIHCMYEMTFYGFTEEKIEAFKASLEKSSNEKGIKIDSIKDLFNQVEIEDDE